MTSSTLGPACKGTIKSKRPSPLATPTTSFTLTMALGTVTPVTSSGEVLVVSPSRGPSSVIWNVAAGVGVLGSASVGGTSGTTTTGVGGTKIGTSGMVVA